MNGPACPNCGAVMEVKRNTKGKGYAVCKPCGAMFQPRSKAGATKWEQTYAGTGPSSSAAPASGEPKPKPPTPAKAAPKPSTPEPGAHGDDKDQDDAWL